ncbi:MAG: aconitate hydratase [Solirubrobacterales bacterium]|nr:aconitate hydratase [Solirubrobacterales bacterium]
MSENSFDARSILAVGGREFEILRLDSLQSKFDVARLPYSIKVLLENALRLEDGQGVSSGDVEAIATWDAKAEPSIEIPFQPARVLMQDFTGVPAVVDLAAMRDAMEGLGGDPSVINPLVPVDLVIDHSVQVDAFGNQKAFAINAERDYERNGERYEFLRWGQEAFDNFRVVPPATGICHQVNLEYLGQCVWTSPRAQAGPGREADEPALMQAYPDTLVGTDSHTTMINGLGVLGWGVGGIEAEAAMLGQPISMLLPQVIGFKLGGDLPEGATATDLVLTVTEMLREHGVVAKFVEFFGPGLANLPLVDRATIGNMSPEFGSTCAIFPIDAETLRYLEFTGRPTEQIELVDAYSREQGLFHEPGDEDATYSAVLELDLGEVQPSIAGPKRPQDRISLSDAKPAFLEAMQEWDPEAGEQLGSPLDEALAESFPASDPPAEDHNNAAGKPRRFSPAAVAEHPRTSDSVSVQLESGETVELDHGRVVIAAITSCTNTSNPSVMLGAGLVAKKAVERGLRRQPWVKTSLAPGSVVVTEYLEKAGLDEYLNQLQFNLVGYGCTTCIGNSGPLPEEISKAISDKDLVVCSVLSGNRNFEGRINPDTRANYLASPPLVVAYALAGRMDIDITTDPIGRDADDEPVYLRDIWPSNEEVAATVGEAVRAEMFTKGYSDVFSGDDAWRAIKVPEGDRYDWPDSTYVREPPYFTGMDAEPTPIEPIEGARVLALLGDSVTTDHISPAGAIKKDSPAGRWLIEQGVEVRDFNSYGSRRGNHEVMIRGTFANVRLRNRLVETEGGFTRHFSGSGEGEETTIYDAARSYADDGVPLVVLAGKEYGSGSSRDWAAKGTRLLGVRAVIAESYERIHRSNLIGIGVLPLQFDDGDSIDSLGLTGAETFSVSDLQGGDAEHVTVTASLDGADNTFDATVRIDTPNERQYFKHGGILHRVLRDLRARA